VCIPGLHCVHVDGPKRSTAHVVATVVPAIGVRPAVVVNRPTLAVRTRGLGRIIGEALRASGSPRSIVTPSIAFNKRLGVVTSASWKSNDVCGVVNGGRDGRASVHQPRGTVGAAPDPWDRGGGGLIDNGTPWVG
jgi:hypothetical protein